VPAREAWVSCPPRISRVCARPTGGNGRNSPPGARAAHHRPLARNQGPRMPTRRPRNPATTPHATRARAERARPRGVPGHYGGDHARAHTPHAAHAPRLRPRAHPPGERTHQRAATPRSRTDVGGTCPAHTHTRARTPCRCPGTWRRTGRPRPRSRVHRSPPRPDPDSGGSARPCRRRVSAAAIPRCTSIGSPRRGVTIELTSGLEAPGPCRAAPNGGSLRTAPRSHVDAGPPSSSPRSGRSARCPGRQPGPCRWNIRSTGRGDRGAQARAMVPSAPAVHPRTTSVAVAGVTDRDRPPGPSFDGAPRRSPNGGVPHSRPAVAGGGMTADPGAPRTARIPR
jgi:hypothetical protein